MGATGRRPQPADHRHAGTTCPVAQRFAAVGASECVQPALPTWPCFHRLWTVSRRASLAHDRVGREAASGKRGLRRPAPYLVRCEGVYELPAVDRLLTAEEIAERLGMRTDWVWAQARAGLIPHIRLGRYRRFRESAVEAWLRELEAKSTVVTPAAPTPLPLRRRA
jgi:excisionase family DNA binding protein